MEMANDDVTMEMEHRTTYLATVGTLGPMIGLVGTIPAHELTHRTWDRVSMFVGRWLLARGEDIVPIPGTKRVKYLEENVGAMNVKLTPEDLRRIDAIAPKGVAAGTRYPEGGMATVNR